MHDGSASDLRAAVLRKVDIEENPWLDTSMREVQLFPSDVPALVAFLESLDGAGYEDAAPRRFPQWRGGGHRRIFTRLGREGRGEREHGLARGWLEPLWCQTPLAPSSP